MLGEHAFNNFNCANRLSFKPANANFKSVPSAYFQGRWFEQSTGKETVVSTITEGSSLFFQFEGTHLEIDFKVLQTMCIVAVSIDHQVYRKMPATERCIVSKCLNPGKHEVRVVVDAIKETDDLWYGGKGLAVRSIVAEKVRPIKPTNKVAWFLGDSITAGIHVNGDPEPETNSYIQSYGNIASENLKLTNIPMAFGATGVTTGGSGDVPKAIEYLDFAMNGVQVDCDQPDICIVNYGTNDRTNRNLFPAEFKTFMMALSQKVPGVPIVVLRPFVGDFAAEIQAAIAGVPNTIYVDTQNWQFERTDGLHPNAVGSKKLGLYLAEKLRSRFENDFFE
ncbi:SGNH/GDSL hydrolase family protein [Lactiplantibacillus garii]|uniref:SGNH/GDSL hydrolase family protein n=1 Tax=Lactiplantibacillus garii TaxID=2306423 RepID=A0A3R8J794_9LACO|nr:SGNH/GDSL hydrolase family protein [Lactiplantibacillus garii]RRK10187.1 SGNH/GDSL hydrolase family protein [Lactiplantibacillus garii]